MHLRFADVMDTGGRNPTCASQRAESAWVARRYLPATAATNADTAATSSPCKMSAGIVPAPR